MKPLHWRGRFVVLSGAATVVLAVACLLVASSTPAQVRGITVDDLRAALYDVDHALPLNAKARPAAPLKDEAPALRSLRVRYVLSYDSACDQRVTAILAVPRRAVRPMPAVLLLAGSGGHKDTDYVRLASDMLNTLGAVTLSIDAQYHGDRARPQRSGDIHFVQNVTNRDAWIQTVRDLRRGVDYLASRKDVDPGRIGFMGFSQGAMIGGTFIGVEPRIQAACLAVPGGGFVEWAQRRKLVPPDRGRDLELGAALTDPVHFLGKFAPRPLLILAARKDELIPEFATQAIISAAGQGADVRWYASGHVLPPAALLVDARKFFAEHLVRRISRRSQCGDELGGWRQERAPRRIVCCLVCGDRAIALPQPENPPRRAGRLAGADREQPFCARGLCFSPARRLRERRAVVGVVCGVAAVVGDRTHRWMAPS